MKNICTIVVLVVVISSLHNEILKETLCILYSCCTYNEIFWEFCFQERKKKILISNLLPLFSFLCIYFGRSRPVATSSFSLRLSSLFYNKVILSTSLQRIFNFLSEIIPHVMLIHAKIGRGNPALRIRVKRFGYDVIIFV
jgi:hypothetical protein